MDFMEQCLCIFLIITKIFLIIRLSTYLKKVNVLFRYFLKAACLILHVWLFFDLINCLNNLSLIFIECIIPLVTQGLIFFVFSYLFFLEGRAYLSRMFPMSLRNISKLNLTSVVPVGKDQSISSVSLLKASVLQLLKLLNLVIISVNNIFQEIFNNYKPGKIVRNISCQITRNTLMFVIVGEYVINEGCRYLIYSCGKGYLRSE